MAGVVSNRLEAHTRGTDLRPGLEARIHDGWWLLARQRQLGELDGHDAGTPISAALAVRALPLNHWQPTGGAVATYGRTFPLEALVETDGGPLPWRDRVAAGLRLARGLRRAGLDASKLIAAHPLAVPAAAAGPAANATSAVTPSEVAATGAVMAGRVIDPDAVAKAYDAGAAAVVTAAGGATAAPVLAAWRTWWRSRQPGRSGAWQPGELEYSLSVTTADATLPVFTASRFGGGSLDWQEFDVAPPATPAATAPATPATTPAITHAVPIPVAFHGAPVGRYWQLEDARTDLGALDTFPTELPKLILSEFTACFAGDWFRLPVRVPYGSAVHIDALVSRDTFGVSTLVPAASAAAGPRPWRMFEHSAASGTPDVGWLLVPPVLAGSIDSAPVEEVALARDPAADLVWGIERTVTNAVGRPVRRGEDLLAQGRVPAPDPRPGLDGAWVWRLATSVPENWIPFLPTRGRAADDDYLLVQGAMLRYERTAAGAVTSTPILPAGLLLPGLPSFPEREIQREGLTLQRVLRLARGVDGGRTRWWTRIVSIGHGEASSGLAYDGLHPTSDDPKAIGE